MKSERRHELHSNELADWIANLPEWAQENRNNIIYGVVIAILVLAAFYLKYWAPQPVASKDQMKMTQLAEELQYSKLQVAGSKDPSAARPELLITSADQLKTVANGVSDKESAAYALIKRGEALRAAVHYAFAMDAGAREQQVATAKKAYEEAIVKAGDNVQVAAMAKLGLGLCEEEAGNYEAAKTAYNELASNDKYNGTVSKLMAIRRMHTMDDYKETFVFVDVPKAAEANAPAMPVMKAAEAPVAPKAE